MQANTLQTLGEIKETAEKFLAIYPKICDLVTDQIQHIKQPVESLPVILSSIEIIQEQQISKLLQEIGAPIHVKGFGYLKTAIRLLQANESLLFAVTKELYPTIAELHDTTPSRAERALRHAIELMAKRCYPRYSSNFVDQPTNSEFLAWCVETLKFQK